MKRLSRTTLGVVAAILLPIAARAQNAPLKPFRTDDDVPVMKAIPVPREAVPPEPEKPIPKATRVVKPGPPETKEKPSAMPEADLTDPTGEIRITPQGTMTPDKVQLSIADGFYSRKAYDQAAPEYERYLGLYPNGPERPSVLYRLAESYRANGSKNAAKNSYEMLLNQYADGELIGPAAYRLAELNYQDKNYSAAIQLYRRASVRLRDPKLINSAKFFAARSLEGLGQKREARLAYDELVGAPNDNPFYDASRLSLALLLKDEPTRQAEALRQIQALAKQTTNDDLRAQATVYAGLWELELDQNAKAAEDLKTALAMPNIGRWQGIAQFGLIQLLFNEKKYQKVIDQFNATGKDVGTDIRPQLLNLVASSYRQLGKLDEAVVQLDQVIKDYPNTLFAKEAAYERLVCLYSSGDPNALGQIEQYLTNNPEPQKRDQVQLMEAELLFKKQDYIGAAPLYALVENSRTLPPTLRGEALYKAGVCYMETKEFERAVNAFSELIKGFPTVKNIPAALVRRGLARLRLSDKTGALADFTDVAQKYPKAKERELALFQKAHILGQQGDNQGMAESFKALLKDYPDTPEAADAHYWIGWVAFENKDYKSAPAPLEKARTANKEEYFDRASLRIMLSHFYLEDKDALAREIDIYIQGNPKGQVPYEVLHWLGQGYFELATASEKKDVRTDYYNSAAKYLAMVTARDDAKPDDFLNLGRTELRVGEFQKSSDALEKYLGTAKEPSSRVAGLLALGHAQIGLKKLDAAQKTADEALSLQPDGELNAKARILAGDIQNARGRFDEAAKVYESVAVVIDDETLTPEAMEKAVEAYKSAGKDAEAKRLLNTLQSRYPEYAQRKGAK